MNFCPLILVTLGEEALTVTPSDYAPHASIIFLLVLLTFIIILTFIQVPTMQEVSVLILW